MTGLRAKPPIRVARTDRDRQRQLVEQSQAQRDQAAREVIARLGPPTRSHADHEAGFTSCSGA